MLRYIAESYSLLAHPAARPAQNHAVIPEMPLYFNVAKLLFGGRSGGRRPGRRAAGPVRPAGQPA